MRRARCEQARGHCKRERDAHASPGNRRQPRTAAHHPVTAVAILAAIGGLERMRAHSRRVQAGKPDVGAETEFATLHGDVELDRDSKVARSHLPVGRAIGGARLRRPRRAYRLWDIYRQRIADL